MKVFISYRRKDDPNFAWRLRDQFARLLGDDNIFFDVDSMRAGVDFVETIRERIAAADCVLIAIGPTWDPARLASEGDYVRMEMLEAIHQKKLLVPVLNADTPMPSANVLPEPLMFFSRLHAATIHPDHFPRDVSALVRQIKDDVPSVSEGSTLVPPTLEQV